MDNHSIPQHSLVELAKKPLNGLKEQQQQTKRASNNPDTTAEALESNVERLLERNAELTKQLESSLLKISRLRKQRRYFNAYYWMLS
ncbi:hypothetical protein BD408DRAFT_235140 [Parasitella parasitica]|nr:hypothetical protein BD408DRAFT_235140 [Parasitella parasitica]